MKVESARKISKKNQQNIGSKPLLPKLLLGPRAFADQSSYGNK